MPIFSLSLLLYTLLLFERFALLLPLLTYCVSDSGLHLLFLLPLFVITVLVWARLFFLCVCVCVSLSLSLQYCHLNTSLFIVYLNHIFIIIIIIICKLFLIYIIFPFVGFWLILKLSSLSCSFLHFFSSFQPDIIIFFIITPVVNVATIVLCVAYWLLD